MFFKKTKKHILRLSPEFSVNERLQIHTGDHFTDVWRKLIM